MTSAASERARWKKAETRVAEVLGGQRTPVNGRQRGSAADIEGSWVCPEVKNRKELPLWLLDAMSQAEASKRGDQLSVVILHKVGTRYKDSLVVLRLSEFQDRFGEVSGE